MILSPLHALFLCNETFAWCSYQARIAEQEVLVVKQENAECLSSSFASGIIALLGGVRARHPLLDVA